MKTSTAVFLAVFAWAAAARAQEVPPPVPPPATQPPVATQAPATTQPPVTVPQTAAASAPAVTVDKQRRREQIGLMEGILEKAVRNGATETARRVQGMMLMSGNARARGFVLDGYGLFFHVEVPGVQPSMASLLEMYERNERDRAERDRAQPRTMGAGAPAPPPTLDAIYTQAVQEKLIDAMLDFGRIDLRSDEWLTVAARDGDGPMPAGLISETFTLVLRIKGADLTDFATGRLTRDEARRRVEVQEF